MIFSYVSEALASSIFREVKEQYDYAADGTANAFRKVNMQSYPTRLCSSKKYIPSHRSSSNKGLLFSITVFIYRILILELLAALGAPFMPYIFPCLPSVALNDPPQKGPLWVNALQ